MSSKAPIVAIIGRANVGKSSLFNCVLKRREAVVASEAGTTRDSITAKATWHDQDFWIVDTAGLKDASDDFELTIQSQISEAAAAADMIWVVIDATTMITEDDRRVAKLAHKTGKPLLLVVNKIDQIGQRTLDEYRRLGVEQMVGTSATQNLGLRELLDKTVSQLPIAKIKDEPQKLTVALLGRPNVGKSALFNALAKKQQAIVADRAGTTRDVNRVRLNYNTQAIELLDTAGIRRSGKIEVGIEKFSVLRSLQAIEAADVCLLLMDVNELNTQLDQKIAGLIREAGKGLILVVSKWDSAEKDAFTRDSLAPTIAKNFDFVPWAPLIFTSSVTGQNVTKIFDLILQIAEERRRHIATSQLNSWLEQMIDQHPPAGLKNTRPKLNYMVQTDDSTPTFRFYGAHVSFLHWSYKRYLERNLRERFGYGGTAIQFYFISKHEGEKKVARRPAGGRRHAERKK